MNWGPGIGTASDEADSLAPVPAEGTNGAAVPVFPSHEWVRTWVAIANESVEFEATGAGWEGAVGAVIEADPEAGVTDTLYVRLEGGDGKWLRWAFGTDAALVEGTAFVFRAGYAGWKELIRQKLHPLVGMLQDKIGVRGHLPVILKSTRAMVVLAKLAGRIHTQFVDELPRASI